MKNMDIIALTLAASALIAVPALATPTTEACQARYEQSVERLVNHNTKAQRQLDKGLARVAHANDKAEGKAQRRIDRIDGRVTQVCERAGLESENCTSATSRGETATERILRRLENFLGNMLTISGRLQHRYDKKIAKGQSGFDRFIARLDERCGPHWDPPAE